MNHCFCFGTDSRILRHILNVISESMNHHIFSSRALAEKTSTIHLVDGCLFFFMFSSCCSKDCLFELSTRFRPRKRIPASRLKGSASKLWRHTCAASASKSTKQVESGKNSGVSFISHLLSSYISQSSRCPSLFAMYFLYFHITYTVVLLCLLLF